MIVGGKDPELAGDIVLGTDVVRAPQRRLALRPEQLLLRKLFGYLNYGLSNPPQLCKKQAVRF